MVICVYAYIFLLVKVIYGLTSLKERSMIIFNWPHIHILHEIGLLFGMGRQEPQIMKSLLLENAEI